MRAPDLKSLIQPPDSSACGQTCIAMIARCSIEEAMNVVGVSVLGTDGTTRRDLLRGLKKLGIKTGKCVNYSNGRAKMTILPEYAILGMVDSKAWWGHWVVKKGGYIYDPSIGYPFPTRVYETYIMSKAYSNIHPNPKGVPWRNMVRWDEAIPILGK